MTIVESIAAEFKIQTWQAEQTAQLLDSGNTVPFIARYRKEMTGNLDDQILRDFSQRLEGLRALDQRRAEINRLIDSQGLLTPELSVQIESAGTLTDLEDLYRPFRPKRRTRASIAREQGLQPLADLLVSRAADQAAIENLARLLAEAGHGIAGQDAALAGAMDILAEQVSDNAWVRRRLRQFVISTGIVESKAKTAAASVYEPYYDYTEPVSRVAAHRILAINRGERGKFLSVKISVSADRPLAIIQSWLIRDTDPDRGPAISAARPYLMLAGEDAWKRLVWPSLETEIRGWMTERAEKQAIQVFAANLKSLLLQPPIRGYCVLGVDPGFRTGCKLAAVDITGQVLETATIYPTPPWLKTREAAAIVSRMVRQHGIGLVAIGNGTASRETEAFISGLIRDESLPVRFMMVSEAGASVYSASALAAAEFPEYDVSLRSAVSIARRLQDPLAELVKIEPRSIGVGQYQHDLDSKELDETLQGVVESCVNQVGVDLNTASASLLSYVAGIGSGVAQNIVRWRNQNGSFSSRQDLLKVDRLGPRAFLQCAGFLRIPGASEPLDNTSVHPESYPQVYALGRILGLTPSPALAAKARLQDESRLAGLLGLGEATFRDIVEALARPGRDPRDDLPQPDLRSDVLEIKDLRPGMVLQGVVRNVADFGVFVDIGVHQDGLVHRSEMTDSHIRNPLALLHAGQPVKVRVLRVDPDRRRIGLTMKGLSEPSETEDS